MKIILDLCGGTGSWSKPYKNAGYDVRLVSHPEHDVRHYDPPENVYGILAAPPCTMFSLARTTAKKPRCFYEGMEVVEACLRIIWEVRKRQKLAFWALENPIGFLRQFLGKPSYTFEPWWFGDDSKKKTDLWGYFKEPTRNKEAKRPSYNRKEWGYRMRQSGLSRAEARAVTPPCFAQAFFDANR